MDRELLHAALFGLEQKRAEIEAKIVEIRRMIGGNNRRSAPAAAVISLTPPRRELSSAARKRIANAQKKRWAAFRKAKAAKAKGVESPARAAATTSA